MKTRRHLAIAKAQHREFVSELTKAEEFLTAQGFTRKEVLDAVIYPYQKAELKRLLRGGRGELRVGRNMGRSYVVGIDVSKGNDKSVITHAKHHEDGTVEIISSEEII